MALTRRFSALCTKQQEAVISVLTVLANAEEIEIHRRILEKDTGIIPVSIVNSHAQYTLDAINVEKQKLSPSTTGFQPASLPALDQKYLKDCQHVYEEHLKKAEADGKKDLANDLHAYLKSSDIEKARHLRDLIKDKEIPHMMNMKTLEILLGARKLKQGWSITEIMKLGGFLQDHDWSKFPDEEDSHLGYVPLAFAFACKDKLLGDKTIANFSPEAQDPNLQAFFDTVVLNHNVSEGSTLFGHHESIMQAIGDGTEAGRKALSCLNNGDPCRVRLLEKAIDKIEPAVMSNRMVVDPQRTFNKDEANFAHFSRENFLPGKPQYLGEKSLITLFAVICENDDINTFEDVCEVLYKEEVNEALSKYEKFGPEFDFNSIGKVKDDDSFGDVCCVFKEVREYVLNAAGI